MHGKGGVRPAQHHISLQCHTSRSSLPLLSHQPATSHPAKVCSQRGSPLASALIPGPVSPSLRLATLAQSLPLRRERALRPLRACGPPGSFSTTITITIYRKKSGYLTRQDNLVNIGFPLFPQGGQNAIRQKVRRKRLQICIAAVWGYQDIIP